MKASLTPCKIGTCTIKNRFVMTAANLGWCDGGYVNDKVTAFYRKRAQGGCGLIIVGAAGVDPVRVNQVGMMQIYDDSFIPPMTRLTEAVHEEGGKIFLQLMHAGAYARRGEHGGIPAVAPSAYLSRFTREETEELSAEEIDKIITYFGDAALRAKKAGFDGVELIGSAGYLIAEFLSKATNGRTDKYGGDIHGRARFLMEVVWEVRRQTGADYPLIVRLSGTDFIPGGNTHEEFFTVGKMIENYVDAINVTGGWHESQIPQITYQVPRGQYLYLAKALKDRVSIPVIGCNRLDAETAEDAIENGFCDMAGILRGFIADPDLVDKHSRDAEQTIRPCLGCNQECLERIFSCKDLRCVVNPYVGQEMKIQAGDESESRNPKEEKRKKVLIVGAGIAGMVCARLLAEDCDVVIREKSGFAGGAGRALSRVPDREDTGAYIEYLFLQCLYAGVRFDWFHEVTEEELYGELKEGRFDRIILADGAGMEDVPFPVEEGAQVIRAEECILHRNPVGKKVVVIGSGYKAVQTVQYLLSCGKKEAEQVFAAKHAAGYLDGWLDMKENAITMIDREDKPGRGFGKSLRWAMVSQLKDSSAAVITGAEIKAVKKDRIIYMSGKEEQEIACDLVVIARGWKAGETFLRLMEDFPGQVERIGDAKRPGRISEAVKDAFEAASKA
ncbi:MAG: FAD-dependent oxidoreductase [Eubacterium sp.]|nr:FAD-dependent oxidoreductase [Eubacterium sp.]